MGVAGSERGLLRVVLPRPNAEAVLEELALPFPQARQSEGSFGDLLHRIRRYFKGEPVQFPDQLDLSGAMPFRKLVWEKTRLIPYGETRSYAWVAGEIGRPHAFRAVGQALKRNPLPLIIPCHRVIGSNGQLVGFAGGTELKKRLLQLEASGA